MSEETLVGKNTGHGLVRVLSASAQRAALTACADAFVASQARGTPDTGILFSWATSGAVTDRIEAGEKFDIIAASQSALQSLTEKRLVSGAIHLAGISRIALGMRKGETPPDISTVELFKVALNAASAFSRGDPAGGGTAGNFLAAMLERIGMLEATRDKSILRVGGYNVMKEVAEGRADFGITQSTEIVAVEGVEISAWLPEDLQMSTVYALAAGPNTISAHTQAFLDFITSANGKTIYAEAGFANA